MLYNSSSDFDAEKAKVYLGKLISKKATIEIIEKRKPTDEDIRTGRQNNTVHMWFSVMADFIGYTSKDDCKRDIKRVILGQKEFANQLTGEIGFEDYETHTMSVGELSRFMDKFKIWAQQEHGCYLPYFGDPGYSEMIQEYKNR